MRLTINPDTFMWADENSLLIYDSQKYLSFQFKLTLALKEVYNELMKLDNLYSIAIDDISIDSETEYFIKVVTDYELGFLSDGINDSSAISYSPVLNMQNSWTRVCALGNQSQTNILPYLTSITIYLGGECPETEYHRQTKYPMNTEQSLSWDRVLAFVASVVSPYLTEISLVFSSIMNYPHIEHLINGLKKYGLIVTVFIRAEENVNEWLLDEILSLGIKIGILHTSPFVVYRYKNHGIKHYFLIESDQDYLIAEKYFCLGNGIYSEEFIPVFNGSNRDFFINRVFLSKQEILNSCLKRREVFAHMVMNTNAFGNLYVRPNGMVYASPSATVSVGSIEDSIYTLILKEMELNTAWRKTRESAYKCNKCIYKYLCPSPTTYEDIMGLECICQDI